MSHASVFRLATLLFILGISAGSLFSETVPFVPLSVLFVGLGAVGTWQDRRSVSVAVLLSAFAFGMFLSAREEVRWSHPTEPMRVSGRAEIIRQPESGDGFRDAVVLFDTCGPGDCPSGLVTVRFSPLDDIAYGDAGSLSCDLTPPDPEWRMWYAKDGIAYRCLEPEWEGAGTTRPVRRALLSFSSRFETATERFLPEPESALAEGLLLGGDRRLPETVRETFRDAGLTHIVAVSGFNISVIAGYFLLFGILLFLPRKRAAPFSLFATVAFVFVAGAPPSAVRALFMVGTLLLAQWLGRRYESLFALVFVAGAMLLFNPLLLVHDVGFQLSFLATAGIVLSTPFIGRAVRNMPKPAAIFLEAFLLTIAANLLLIPVLFATFGSFSPMAIPVNTVLLPLVPVSMLFSFLVGFFGMFSATLGTILSFPAYATLHLIVEGARFGARFHDTAVIWDGFGPFAAIVWYGMLAFPYLRFRKRI